ncbi:hypothetical protein P8452_68615 [Trifolium repens]|nr:hypothetical protein P8452_68615 [Trifolium repens]
MLAVIPVCDGKPRLLLKSVITALGRVLYCCRQTVKSSTIILKAICTCFHEIHKPSICLIPNICKQMSMCQHYYNKALG